MLKLARHGGAQSPAQQRVPALQGAWQALTAAVAKAQELDASGARAEVLQDWLRHARELLSVIDREIAAARGKRLSVQNPGSGQILPSPDPRGDGVTTPGAPVAKTGAPAANRLRGRAVVRCSG